MLVCLTSCGHGRGNGARPREMADSRVLRPTRRIHIRRRGRVLRDSSNFRGFRPAAAPTVAAHGTSGRVRRGALGLGLTPAPCAAAPVVFAAIRAAMLRRRDTASSPCDVSHRASDEPRRRMSLSSALAPSSLASPARLICRASIDADLWYNVMHENEALVVANGCRHDANCCSGFGSMWLQALCQLLLCSFMD